MMSSQRGNVKRTRPQKHKNNTAFKNDLFDTSKRTKEINSIEVSQVCKQCKDVIEWKIKYKKYRPLTQPKTCSCCHLKTVKMAYHVLCETCASKLGVCPKCRQSSELIQPEAALKTKEEALAEMEGELGLLPERKRRALLRYLDQLYEKKKGRRKATEQAEISDRRSTKKEGINDNAVRTNANANDDHYPDYVEAIKKKLEELGKDLEGVDLNDDFDDLNDDDDDVSEDDYYSVINDNEGS